MIKDIIFDFDGVIIDSNKIKKDAYFKIFDQNNESCVKKILDKSNTKSRYEIIALITAHCRTRYKDPRYYIEKYSKETLDVLSDKNLIIKSIKHMINELYFSGFKLFIISNTPTYDLSVIVTNIGLKSYFEEILGSPNSKKFNYHLLTRKYDMKDTLYVGDSFSDYEFTREVNIPFVGFNNSKLIYASDYYLDYNFKISDFLGFCQGDVG